MNLTTLRRALPVLLHPSKEVLPAPSAAREKKITLLRALPHRDSILLPDKIMKTKYKILAKPTDILQVRVELRHLHRDQSR